MKINMPIPVIGAIVKAAAELKNIPVEIKQNHTDPIRAQRRELRKLLTKAQFTEFGKFYHFDEILLSRNIQEEFRKRVPVFDYNKMHDAWWHLNLEGKRNIAWPGKIKYFALSSGTSEAASKYIPITNGLNNMRLNVSDLPSGVYFVRVSNETSTAVGKFVVE